MSELVDMWTSELAKLRSQGPATSTVSAGSSNPASPKSGRAEESSTLWWPLPIWSRAVPKLSPPAVACSEASVSMVVEWLSP
ncbi:hypothetical protein NMG60_11019635 [Bertholletia excelsa]